MALPILATTDLYRIKIKPEGEGMPRLPYFPLNPWEYLLDEKIEDLELEQEGALLRLWCWMWINPHKRGHLLYNKNTPISDEQIAKKLKISCEKFEKVREKLLFLGLLKVGRYSQLYSPRLSKYKTNYELYEKGSRGNREKIGGGSGLTLPNHTIPKEDIDSLVELFNSTCPSLPKVQVISKTRKTKIILRLKEHSDLNWWKSVFEKAEKIVIESKDRIWRPSFDWLIKNDSKAIEVTEGQYDKYIKDKDWRKEFDDKS